MSEKELKDNTIKESGNVLLEKCTELNKSFREIPEDRKMESKKEMIKKYENLGISSPKKPSRPVIVSDSKLQGYQKSKKTDTEEYLKDLLRNEKERENKNLGLDRESKGTTRKDETAKSTPMELGQETLEANNEREQEVTDLSEEKMEINKKKIRLYEAGDYREGYIIEMLIIDKQGRTMSRKNENAIKIYGILKEVKKDILAVQMVSRFKAEITFRNREAANYILLRLEGNDKYRAYIPARQLERWGVCYDWGDDLEMLKETLSPNQGEIKFERMKKRIVRDGKPELVEGRVLLLKFKGNKLPTRLRVCDGFISIGIKPFIRNVKICAKCLKFGHSKDFCRSEQAKCVTCGANEHGICSRPPRCFNCGGAHKASDRICKKIQREREILKRMAYLNCCVEEAIRLVNLEEKDMSKYNNNVERWEVDIDNRSVFPDLPRKDNHYGNQNNATEYWENKPIPGAYNAWRRNQRTTEVKDLNNNRYENVQSPLVERFNSKSINYTDRYDSQWNDSNRKVYDDFREKHNYSLKNPYKTRGSKDNHTTKKPETYNKGKYDDISLDELLKFIKEKDWEHDVISGIKSKSGKGTVSKKSGEYKSKLEERESVINNNNEMTKEPMRTSMEPLYTGKAEFSSLMEAEIMDPDVCYVTEEVTESTEERKRDDIYDNFRPP